MNKMKRMLLLVLSLVLLVFTGCQSDGLGSTSTGDSPETSQEISLEEASDVSGEQENEITEDQITEGEVTEDGHYTTKDEVALYIHTYGHLPSNFISKTKARKAGWVSKDGNLDEVLPGMSIGGSVFNDYDEQLPAAKGRTWTECDINYSGGYRGAERIIFSNDGLVYYTDDHYKSFEQLY